MNVASALEELGFPCIALDAGQPAAANAQLLQLLGIDDLAQLEAEFQVVHPERGQLAGAELPWSRLAAGAAVEEREIWTDRRTGARHWLRVRAAEVGGAPALRVDPEPGGGLAELARLAAAIADRVLAVEDTRSLATELVDRVRYAVGARAVWVLARPESTLVLQAHSGAPTRAGFERLLEPDAPVARCADERRAVYVEGIDGSGAGWRAWLAEQKIGSFGAVPLVDEGVCNGVICFGHHSAEGLSPLEREALVAACAPWAAGLQRRRSRDVEERARSSMRALVERAQARQKAEQPLRELLRVVVEQACLLTGARYGAMGVLNREHTDLEDFVVYGISDEQAARIGHLPTGKGILGEVIRQRRTLRVAEIARHPASYGFPANHPPMRTFLGSPLRIGDEVFGNFYLTDKQGGAEFTDEDARVLEAFSAQASLTVGYARETGAQRRLLDAMLRHAPHGILFFVTAEQIAFGNAAAERMLGLPHGAGMRHGGSARAFELQFPDGSAVPRDQYLAARAIRGEVVANQEFRIVRPEEPPLPVLASGAPVWSETGAMLGAVVAFQDISAYKELERVREEFAAVVAHDLRNPVQAIAMQLDLLERRASDGSVVVAVESLRRMQRSAQRLAHLINDLLDASRIEGGRLDLDRRAIDLGRAVRGLVEQIEPTLGKHAVRMRIDEGVPEVRADLVRVEQVLTNLLENAAKYSGENSPIDVRVAASGDGAMVTVSDRGPGIQPEDLPRLFDRHYQTQRARAKRSGLGLGLFITHGLVEAHGGRLWAESTPGVGSAFHVWLPAFEPAAAHAPS